MLMLGGKYWFDLRHPRTGPFRIELQYLRTADMSLRDKTRAKAAVFLIAMSIGQPHGSLFMTYQVKALC